MKQKSRIAVQVVIITVMFCLLSLSSIVYAAPPAATQKPAAQVQAAPSAASRMLDRNAPPSGTITITSPASGETWYVGSRKDIQWTCTGSCSLVDVTLWKGGVKTFVVGTAIGSGRTSYTIPTNAAAGSYELRVTSEYDTGVEARQPLSVQQASISIIAPKQYEAVYMGSPYKITWTYQGDPGPVEIYSLTMKGAMINTQWQKSSFLPGSFSAVTQASGQGSIVWQVPSQPFWDDYGDYSKVTFHFTIQGTTNKNIMVDSAEFVIACANSSYCIGKYRGYCANLRTDVNSCGSCGNDCQRKLAPEYYASGALANAVCVNGQCQCIPGETLCAGKTRYYCTNLKTDGKSCGTCGTACPAPFTSCNNGTCGCPPSMSTVCPNTRSPGGIACVNVSGDATNCGKCGNVCPYKQPYCSNGNCQANDPNMPPDLQTVLPSPI